MLAVTIRAAQAGLRVGTASELRMRARVAVETDIGRFDRGFGPKSEHGAECTPGRDVLTDVTVAIEAGRSPACALPPVLVLEDRMRIVFQLLEFVGMTGAAKGFRGFGAESRFLGNRSGRPGGADQQDHGSKARTVMSPNHFSSVRGAVRLGHW